MRLTISLSRRQKFAAIVSTCASTMTNPDDVKDKFYEDLNAVITAVPCTDKLNILGDFNARVGSDGTTWEGMTGKHGVGNCNSNGLLLLQTCVERDLLITNTTFRLPTRNRTSWLHPRSKHWHLLLQDVYYYFQKSEKRQQEFANLQELFDIEQKRMLKHTCTRWLSIGRCLERLLQNWETLKAFFKEEKKALDSKRKSGSCSDKSKVDVGLTDRSYAEKKIENISKFLQSRTNKLYTLFLSNAVTMFDPVLVGLQAEEPKIHSLRNSLLKLLRAVMCRFLKPSALSSGPLEDVDFNSQYNMKSDKDLVIGEACRTFIADPNSTLRESRLKEFYIDVKRYYQAVCGYLVQKLPLREPLLMHTKVASTSLQQTAEVHDLMYFLKRYPVLRPFGCTVDTVVNQFTLYQCTDISDCVGESVQRLDETWAKIGKLTDDEGTAFLFELSVVMRGILTIPHSNAHCERIFSTVRKNRTDQRASLSDHTLESLLLIKAKPGHPFDKQRQHPAEKLRKWKSAYYNSLNQ